MVLTGKRIIVSGAGTGGHITPLVHVADQLRAANQLLWIGDATPLAQRLAGELGIAYVAIPAAKFNRYFTLANFRIPLTVFRGVRAAKEAIARFRPDIVFAKGGYASLPVVLAASDLQIPIVVHESDAVMGWSNRMASRYAQRICTAFPVENYPALPRDRVIQTGLPIAPIFFSVRRRRPRGKHRLLVTGGSQGAHAINEAIRTALPQLRTTWQVDHIVGPHDLANYRALSQPDYRIYDFVDQPQLAQLIADSDVVLGRASATTFIEVASVGRPMVVVPLPLAANGHQQRNAEIWTAARAAIVLDQADLTPSNLIVALESASAQTTPAGRRQFVRRDAVEAIIRVLSEVLR